MYLEKSSKILKKYEKTNTRLYSPKATVHSHDLEGGKRTFERYLGVTWDRVSFITPEEAKEAVKI